MPKLIDLSGQRFGRLIVVGKAESAKNRARTTMWLCKCDCGNASIVGSAKLRKGHTKSCGCLRTEAIKKEHPWKHRHGGVGSRLYKIWVSMKSRCTRIGAKDCQHYGTRGIRVCKEWQDSFECFREWSLINGYNDQLTIDRIDVNGDYCPENCRWATAKTQANNRTNTIYLTFNGKTNTLAQWAEITGIPYATIRTRINRGWAIERALTEPSRQYKKNG